MCEYCDDKGKGIQCYSAVDNKAVAYIETDKNNQTVLITCVVDQYGDGGDCEMDINYCPMCGRKLDG